MPTYNTVKPEDLIAHCMRFLNEGWGYIYGACGQIWTQAQQDAKSKTDEQIRKYGQQWVGKHVIDCSGVWYLAMQELGSYMYHGSNTMWDKFTVSKGRLSKGKRTDGKELKPGTAIFTGINDGDHNHVGIYIGDGKVLRDGMYMDLFGTQQCIERIRDTFFAQTKRKINDYTVEAVLRTGKSNIPDNDLSIIRSVAEKYA